MLLGRLAAAGVSLHPVQARVTGGHDPSELVQRDAVALVPVGRPGSEGVVQVRVEGVVTLPSVVLWPVGPVSAAVERLRAALPAAD